MKIKIRTIVISLLLFVVTIFSFNISVYADTQQDIYSRISSDITAANNFFDRVETSSNPDTILNTYLPTLRVQLNASSRYYISLINSEQDAELKSILTKINSAITGMSASLIAVESAVANGDEQALNIAAGNYDSYINDLNSAVKELDNHYGAVDYEPLLAILFWVTLVISATLFIMSRGSPVLPAEQLRNEFEFALFKASLWPFAGAAISYFWLLATPPGGTFYFLWGIIGIGFFQFFRGLYGYLRYSRPAINLAKHEQQKKLETLISSEDFQQESLREKAQEIAELKPVIRIGKADKEPGLIGEDKTDILHKRLELKGGSILGFFKWLFIIAGVLLFVIITITFITALLES